MKKNSLFVIIMLLAFGTSYAQKIEELSFSEKTYDFGTVKEEAGPITHEFVFTNNSPKPIKIINVKASCGCTTPGWSKEPIAPGKSGFIQAKYNPRNRPGVFNKSLTVTTDADEPVVKLYIKGKVTPKVKSIEEELSTVMGGLKVKHKSLNLGKVKTTDQPTVKEFDVYNATGSLITFSDAVKAPAHIKVEVSPKTLKGNEKGVIKIIYDAKAKNDFGFMNENITLETDEKTDNVKSFSVYATIEEYFPPMTEAELAKAPRLKLENKEFDFGKIQKGESIKAEFMFTNVGKSPLEIRKANSNCSCTISKVEKTKVKPGKSSKIVVTFNSEGRRGNQQKSVTLYSNDPLNPVQRLTIKGVVKDAGM